MLPILVQSLVLHFSYVRICDDDSGSVILEDVAASLGTLSSGAVPSVVFPSLSVSAMASTSSGELVANGPHRLVANDPLRKELFSWKMLEFMLEFEVRRATKRWAAGIQSNCWLSSPTLIPDQKARPTQTPVFHSLAFLHVFDRVYCVP